MSNKQKAGDIPLPMNNRNRQTKFHPWPCNSIPANVPDPSTAQIKLHPRKDVFVLKVAKVGPKGDRRTKMEIELVTPKAPEKKPLCRIDTRETQCDPEPTCHCCIHSKKKHNN